MVGLRTRRSPEQFSPPTARAFGSVMLDGAVIQYAGLEPIALRGTAADVVINLTAGDDQAILTDNLLADYAVQLTLKGTSVSVGGQFVTNWAYNAAAVDGAVGVLARGGTTSFDRYQIRANAPAPAAGGEGEADWVSVSPVGSTVRLQVAGTWEAADVNRDGDVTALDVLIVINAIHQPAGGFVAAPELAGGRYDLNGDEVLSALDALLVINQVNAAPLAEGEAAQGIALRREPSAEARLELYPGLDKYDVDDKLAQGVSDQRRLDAAAAQTDDEHSELRALSRFAVNEALDELLQGA